MPRQKSFVVFTRRVLTISKICANMCEHYVDIMIMARQRDKDTSRVRYEGPFHVQVINSTALWNF